jgi:hypothetical protein
LGIFSVMATEANGRLLGEGFRAGTDFSNTRQAAADPPARGQNDEENVDFDLKLVRHVR